MSPAIKSDLNLIYLNVFFGKVENFNGPDGDLKSISKKLSPGRYRVPKFVQTKKRRHFCPTLIRPVPYKAP